MKIKYKIYVIETAPNEMQSSEAVYNGYYNEMRNSYGDSIKNLREYNTDLYDSMQDAVDAIDPRDKYETITILPIIR